MASLRVKAANIGVLSPSDAAVDELMRGMFVDRGPSKKKLKITDALEAIKKAAGPMHPRKFASMFALCIKKDEL